MEVTLASLQKEIMAMNATMGELVTAVKTLTERDHGRTGDRKDYLLVPDLAKRYGVCEDTVRGWCHDGRIRYRKVGKSFQFLPNWLEEFEAKNTISPIRALSRGRRG